VPEVLTRRESEVRAPSVARAADQLPPFEVVGPPGAPVVVALGGISATRHVTSSDADASAGWWEDVVGVGRAIDTRRFRVLGVDFADGGRARDGRPARAVTTHDQARAIARALDAIGADQAHAVVGASYGGMVALAFAEEFPRRLERLVIISAPHEPHPMSTALRAVQRQIVELGLATGETRRAMTIARGLAMTTYRSREEFAERFDRAPIEQSPGHATFPVEAYLRAHGERFAARWSAERFLALSLSADLHRVDPRAIRTPAIVIAAEGDAIVPRAQLETLVSHLAGPAQLVDLASTRGHDAFLTEPDALGRILGRALSTIILS
jgi:homoserine O-acetyltransferase/O-succinyltransferase